MLLFLLFFWLPNAWGFLDTKDIVIIVLSQENEYHSKLAVNLRQDLHKQAETLQKDRPIVHLSHRDFPHVGGWTILPLITRLADLHKDNSSWMFFAEDRTEIKLGELLSVLSKYNQREKIWLGHASFDHEATIIHHFAFNENPKFFKYPNIASGFAISTALIARLAERIAQQQQQLTSDFGIDNSYELALFIWDKGAGPMLQNESALCIENSPRCAAFPKPFHTCNDEIVDRKSIYFAIKTCGKYHKERVPVVKKTWAKHAPNLIFFSDVKDESIPTVTLGIPNTEYGHCAKTLNILRYIHKKIDNLRDVSWIVLADDDTILGISRIQQLLTCYNASTAIALGERYGYNVYNPRGYNYITGGGGIVFSRVLIEKLVQPGICDCPSINTPDDMYLGVCFSRLGVTVTHSPLFHQARPIDYPFGYLRTKDAVSFHKHWMIDPINVYNKWFGEEDSKFDLQGKHDEL